jgi:hypothetical protein
LAADSDGDGFNDLIDRAPNDPNSHEGPATSAPAIQLEKKEVILTPVVSMANIGVTVTGSSTLLWSARSDDESLVITTPAAPDTRGTGKLSMRTPEGFNFGVFAVAATRVRVQDDLGGSPEQIVSVRILGNFGSDTAITSQLNSTGGVSLAWTAVQGRIYQVQYSDGLPTWKNPTNGRFSGNASGKILGWVDSGIPVTDAAPNTRPLRFYRIIVVPQ